MADEAEKKKLRDGGWTTERRETTAVVQVVQSRYARDDGGLTAMQSRVDFDTTRRSFTAVNFDATKNRFYGRRRF